MSLTETKVLATLMVEVLGGPPEHLTKALEDLIKKMSEEKDVKVKSHVINKPKNLEENKALYTTFAEVDVEVDSLKEMMVLVFKYMPSHVEIVSPENIKVENNLLNELFNELTRRLHAYDEVARVIQNEKAILEKKLKETINKDNKNDESRTV